MFILKYNKGSVNMKKEFGGTYLGLDMGTASVGYAVTDKAYKILKFIEYRNNIVGTIYAISVL